MKTPNPTRLDAIYFDGLARLLDAEGEARPRLIIDLEQVDHNLSQVRTQLGPKALRLVEKSLPCGPLLEYLMQAAGSHRLMTFHLPFLLEDARRFPHAELLLGKPLPVAAARHFYAHCPATFDANRQLHWLIDDLPRLIEYHRLATTLGRRLNITLEIDIGLHRGGFSSPAALDPALAYIAQHPAHLHCSGLMGYDAHVGILPRLLGRPQRLADEAMSRYAAFHARLASFPTLATGATLLNTGGSPSYPFHTRETVSSEIAVGTALLQPCGYDYPQLASHRPAVFIATPLLKSAGPLQLPGLGRLPALLTPTRETHFIYGGNWMADYCWPPGLRHSALHGRSSNQEMATAPRESGLRPGQWVFLRPRQTESVLTQFGDILAVRGGQLEGRWQPYRE